MLTNTSKNRTATYLLLHYNSTKLKEAVPLSSCYAWFLSQLLFQLIMVICPALSNFSLGMV